MQLSRLLTSWFSDIALDRARFALWSPVVFGLGILLYFSLDYEPRFRWTGLGFLGCSALLWYFRNHRVLRICILGVWIVGLGLITAQIRSHSVYSTVLPLPMKPVWVWATVEKIEYFGNGYRVWLKDVDIWKFPKELTPQKIRLNIKTAVDPTIRAGDKISVKAGLSPPPGPVMPGGYDYRKIAYFDRIGATGYSVSPLKKRAAFVQPERYRFQEIIQSIRQTMTTRIYNALKESDDVIGDRAAVSAALITGEQGSISKATLEDFRVSGLAHILSISGLHLVLVTGTCFFVVRLLLASIASIALHYPIKKWAAFVALAVGFLYLLIADSPVPAERSFIMVGFFLLAVMLDRTGTPMRPVAFAAAAILILQPETVLSASFQMSFASVMALVATYESLPWLNQTSHRSWAGRFGIYLGGIIISSLVAGLATAPFAIYHFGRYSVYGLIANLAALPVTSVLVMPFALLGSLVMPFGLEKWALIPMGWGVDIILVIGHKVAQIPYANIPVYSGSMLALAFGVFGLLWISIWRQKIRWLGVPLIILSFVLVPFNQPPDIWLDRGGKLIALRLANGDLAFSSRISARYSRKSWQQANAQEGIPIKTEEIKNYPELSNTKEITVHCEPTWCRYQKNGQQALIVFKEHKEELSRECEGISALVWLPDQPMPCSNISYVLTAKELREEGTTVWWLNRGGIKSRSVEEVRGKRLWTSMPEMHRSF